MKTDQSKQKKKKKREKKQLRCALVEQQQQPCLGVEQGGSSDSVDDDDNDDDGGGGGWKRAEETSVESSNNTAVLIFVCLLSLRGPAVKEEDTRGRRHGGLELTSSNRRQHNSCGGYDDRVRPFARVVLSSAPQQYGIKVARLVGLYVSLTFSFSLGGGRMWLVLYDGNGVSKYLKAAHRLSHTPWSLRFF